MIPQDTDKRCLEKMKFNILFKLRRFIEAKNDTRNKEYFDWKMREYLSNNEVGGVEKYDSFCISPTSKIYGGRNLVLGKGLCVGEHCVIDAHDSFGIYIGENLLLAPDVFIRAGNHDYSYFEDAFQNHGHCAKKIDREGKTFSIIIEDNVWIGRGATVLSGANIGKGSVIGAGSVVKETIPEYSIVVGNPAQVVSSRRKRSFINRSDIGLFA